MDVVPLYSSRVLCCGVGCSCDQSGECAHTRHGGLIEILWWRYYYTFVSLPFPSTASYN